jgi:hypothetical protein
MSEQSPEKAALNEEPEVEGHMKALRPEEELVEEEGPEVEGHLKMGSTEDPSVKYKKA